MKKQLRSRKRKKDAVALIVVPSMHIPGKRMAGVWHRNWRRAQLEPACHGPQRSVGHQARSKYLEIVFTRRREVLLRALQQRSLVVPQGSLQALQAHISLMLKGRFQPLEFGIPRQLEERFDALQFCIRASLQGRFKKSSKPL